MHEHTIGNPWLRIPAEDYEGHMASPGVGQLQILNKLFQQVLDEFQPASLAVIGCSTGNGFEHIDPFITRYVVGIDINAGYLAVAEKRYAHLPCLTFRCADITRDDIGCDPVDLVHAALVFEYVNVEEVLPRITGLMNPGATLIVGLQLPSSHADPVTKTGYTSLESLSPIMHLVDPQEFGTRAAACGLEETASFVLPLKKGKELFVGYYRKR